MNLTLGKTETIAASVLLVVILFGAFFIFAYRPAMQTIASYRAQEEEVKRTIKSNRLTLGRLQEARKEASEVEMKIVNLMSKMPDRPEIPSLLVQLEDVAEKSGAKIQTFKPSTPNAAGAYQVVPVDVSLKSEFNGVPTLGGSLVEFLYRLDNFPRLIAVNSIQIARSGMERTLTVTLKLNAFCLSGQSASQAGAQTAAPSQ
jgi:type IV pilus assembly protein PilO